MDESGTESATQNQTKRRRVKKKVVEEPVEGDSEPAVNVTVSTNGKADSSIEKQARKLQTGGKGETAVLLDNQDGSKQPTPAESEQATPTLSKSKQKKRPNSKQRKPKAKPVQDETNTSEANESAVEQNAQSENENEATLDSSTVKPERRKKRRKSPVKDTQNVEVPPLDLNGSETQRSAATVSPISNIGQRILSVTIHRTDRLKPDLFLAHPVVRVHLVDELTGEYIQKLTADRPVTSHYESSNVHHIQCVMTQPFDFKERRSTLPVWDEQLVFNESFAYLVNSPALTAAGGESVEQFEAKHKLLLLFELVETVNFSTAAKRFNTAHGSSGFHVIGWAFLKIVSQSGTLNVGKRLRLQLYNPVDHFQKRANVPDTYLWWKLHLGNREAYPSTLHVSINAILPPTSMLPAQRSLAPMQPEEGSQPAQQFLTMHDPNVIRSRLFGQLSPRSAAMQGQHWSKLEGQPFRIPNTQSLSLAGSPKGCIRAKFSRNGLHLACAQQETADIINIVVYQFPSGRVVNRYNGHSNIVYDLSWSASDSYLLSCSSDCTARLWNVSSGSPLPDRVLTHPSYVYSGQMHPVFEDISVTGCFDRTIRIWQIDLLSTASPKLIKVIDDHRGHINAVCFNPAGTLLCSGDSVGLVKVWNFNAQQDDAGVTKLTSIALNHDVRNDEFRDVPVNKLQLVHLDNRLIIHTRDSIIRLYDLRLKIIAKRYIGSMNYKEHLHSVVTPCGTFLFAPSEDTHVYVWNVETGDHVATYTKLGFRNAVFAIDFHPSDNYIVFSSFGAEVVPIIVYFYNVHIAKQEVGIDEVPSLELMDDMRVTSTNAGIGTSTKKIDESPRPASGMSSARNWDNFAKTQQNRLNTALERLSAAVTLAQATGPGASFANAAESLNIRDPKHITPQQALRLEQSVVSRPGTAMSAGRMTLDMDKPRPQFTFKPPRTPGALDATDGTESRDRVVALYDYNSQRSDELTFKAGDILTILYRDTDNWWMGEMVAPEGVGTVQGFVPSNYVALLQATNAAPTAAPRNAGRSSLRMSGNELTAVTDRFGKVSIVDTSRMKKSSPIDSVASTNIPMRSMRSNLVSQSLNNEAAQHSDSALGGSTASSANASPAQTDSRRNSGRRVRLASGTMQESNA